MPERDVMIGIANLRSGAVGAPAAAPAAVSVPAPSPSPASALVGRVQSSEWGATFESSGFDLHNASLAVRYIGKNAGAGWQSISVFNWQSWSWQTTLPTYHQELLGDSPVQSRYCWWSRRECVPVCCHG